MMIDNLGGSGATSRCFHDAANKDAATNKTSSPKDIRKRCVFDSSTIDSKVRRFGLSQRIGISAAISRFDCSRDSYVAAQAVKPGRNFSEIKHAQASRLFAQVLRFCQREPATAG
jgi:hypothetical protein